NATLELPETLTDGDATDIIGDRADLLKALATLTEEERTIVILAVCDGYTSAEISKIMAINANTIRSKQLRALAKLRAVME
ncbi:MAG: sigma-70 family RNA polymerase sigma factor, partial [Oscillospiraceae bacterium]